MLKKIGCRDAGIPNSRGDYLQLSCHWNTRKRTFSSIPICIEYHMLVCRLPLRLQPDRHLAEGDYHSSYWHTLCSIQGAIGRSEGWLPEENATHQVIHGHEAISSSFTHHLTI